MMTFTTSSAPRGHPPRLRPREVFGQASVCHFDGGKRWGRSSALRATHDDVGIGAAYEVTSIYLRSCAMTASRVLQLQITRRHWMDLLVPYGTKHAIKDEKVNSCALGAHKRPNSSRTRASTLERGGLGSLVIGRPNYDPTSGANRNCHFADGSERPRNPTGA
jgi:hypothetical protein